MANKSKSAKHISDIKLALAGDNHLILATDPDREGEAISWQFSGNFKEAEKCYK